jgi:hypothetical protein
MGLIGTNLAKVVFTKSRSLRSYRCRRLFGRQHWFECAKRMVPFKQTLDVSRFQRVPQIV